MNTRLLTIMLMFVLGGSLVLAQENTCPAIVQAALDAADQNCSSLGRNQACYGNITLETEPQAGITNLQFTQPGDIAEVKQIRSLTLLPLDEAANVWGIALMKIQANLPNTVPGENVSFLLFGNVNITDATEAAPATPTINVTATNSINVRSGPSTTSQRIGSLGRGESATAIGRSVDSSWLQIEVEDGSTIGWVSSPLVTTNGEVSVLPVSEGAQAVRLNPMQAFYFRSGANDALCSAAPDSGILIQTPAGQGKIELSANEVQIVLGSTIYVQAQPGSDMLITVIEGSVLVTAQDVSRVVPAGTRVRVPLDNQSIAAGPPTAPEGYSRNDVQALPVNLLEQAITIAAPLPSEEVAALSVPNDGNWNRKITDIDPNCGDIAANFLFSVTLEESGNVLVEEGGGTTLRYDRSETGVYRFTDDNGDQATEFIVSPTIMQFEFVSADGNCTVRGSSTVAAPTTQAPSAPGG